MSEAAAWGLVVVVGAATLVYVVRKLGRAERKATVEQPCPTGRCAHLYRQHGYVAVLAGDLPQQSGYRCGVEGCRCGWPGDPSADLPPTVARDGRIDLPGRP